MALTRDYQRIGTSTYTVTGNNELRLYAKYNSQSIANNTSNVTLQLRTIALNGSYNSSGNSSTLVCNYDNKGTQYYDIGTVNTYSEKTIGTWTFDIRHNADGTSTGNYASASANVYGNINPSVGGWFDLPSIPRQANITSAPDFNDEENPTITYSNPAGNSVTSLEACISLTGATDDIAYRPVSKTGISYTFNLTETERNILRNATPNSNTLYVDFYLKTILGGNTYFSIVNKKVTIINGNPTFNNFEFEDINSTTLALTGNSQYNVNGYSKIKATISTSNKAVAKKGASMTKYRFSIGSNSTDITYSSSTSVNGNINNATSGTYNVYAIDSRNNSTLVTKLATREIKYQEIYINPTQTSISRNNNQVGTNAILTLNGTFWNGSFGQVTNTIKSVTYQLKKSDSSTWITGTTRITPTVSGNNFTFEGQIASDNQDTTWDLDSSYNVKITINDELSTKTIELVLNSAIPTLSMDKEGIGIMCAYNRNIGGGGQLKGNPLAYYYIGCIIETYTSTNPSTYFGGTWQRYGTGRVTVDVNTSDTDFNTIGKTGGSKTHKHLLPLGADNNSIYASINEEKTSYYVGTNGGKYASWTGLTGTSINAIKSNGESNVSPYITVYRWRRTA